MTHSPALLSLMSLAPSTPHESLYPVLTTTPCSGYSLFLFQRENWGPETCVHCFRILQACKWQNWDLISNLTAFRVRDHNFYPNPTSHSAFYKVALHTTQHMSPGVSDAQFRCWDTGLMSSYHSKVHSCNSSRKGVVYGLQIYPMYWKILVKRQKIKLNMYFETC